MNSYVYPTTTKHGSQCSLKNQGVFTNHQKAPNLGLHVHTQPTRNFGTVRKFEEDLLRKECWYLSVTRFELHVKRLWKLVTILPWKKNLRSNDIWCCNVVSKLEIDSHSSPRQLFSSMAGKQTVSKKDPGV